MKPSDIASQSVNDVLLSQAEDAFDRSTEAPLRDTDELFAMWGAARAEANLAYDEWCEAPGPRAYAIYRAAEDRADAAETALVAVTAVRQAWQPPRAA